MILLANRPKTKQRGNSLPSW